LNKIFISLDAKTATPERTNNAGGYGLPQPERIADGNDEITDFQQARIGKVGLG